MRCEKEKDGQIDTNWKRDDAARFRGRESSAVLRKNNNSVLNYRLVSPICRAACAAVIKGPRAAPIVGRRCRSAPAETMARGIVSEIIQTETDESTV